MRILLVDDDVRVTEALDRLLFQLGDESWDIVTAQSAAEALDQMAAAPASILVSDMRMPQMSGDELLSIVSQRWPETVRVMLSGHVSEETAARAAMYAHQFLAKPCTPASLMDVLRRSERFAEVIRDPVLRAALGGTTALPPAPAAFAKLSVMLASDETSIADIAAVVRADPALSAKVLQLVNSAFFAAAARITDVGRAAARLGARTIQTVVLTAELQKRMQASSVGRDLWRDGELAAAEVGEIARGRPYLTDCWTAALLSPVGLLALADAQPGLLSALLDAQAAGSAPDACDRELLGTSRHFVSAALLSVWGLPDSVVEPLRASDRPSEAPEAYRRLANALHVAIGRATRRPIDAAAEHAVRDSR